MELTAEFKCGPSCKMNDLEILFGNLQEKKVRVGKLSKSLRNLTPNSVFDPCIDPASNKLNV